MVEKLLAKYADKANFVGCFIKKLQINLKQLKPFKVI